MSRLPEEILRQGLRDEEMRRLYDAFGQLGEPGDETEVEFALPAQAQVLDVGDR